ncbi:hypothetical protein PIB30_037422 [Stylosanthes scabra]|uniref:Uncharacterized protein n=1 Tax=Stylosanthes scabra TaxID=79078 RepID=A0ABU6ZCF3_9FABA|nr:hypothetical protein [Stylosanthes scabra]
MRRKLILIIHNHNLRVLVHNQNLKQNLMFRNQDKQKEELKKLIKTLRPQPETEAQPGTEAEPQAEVDAQIQACKEVEEQIQASKQVQHASNIEDVAWVEIQAQILACKEAQADIIEPELDNQDVVHTYKVVEAIIEASNKDEAQIKACKEVECKIGGSKEDKASSDINKFEKPPQTHATEEEEDDFDRPSFDLGIGSPPIQ